MQNFKRFLLNEEMFTKGSVKPDKVAWMRDTIARLKKLGDGKVNAKDLDRLQSNVADYARLVKDAKGKPGAQARPIADAYASVMQDIKEFESDIKNSKKNVNEEVDKELSGLNDRFYSTVQTFQKAAKTFHKIYSPPYHAAKPSPADRGRWTAKVKRHDRNSDLFTQAMKDGDTALAKKTLGKLEAMAIALTKEKVELQKTQTSLRKEYEAK